jgi:hypothetical protein
MEDRITRRGFHTALAAAGLAAGTVVSAAADDAARDYPAPTFVPTLKKPRLGGTFIQDFVIFGHYDLDMVKRLLEKDPAVLNSTVDWGGGDWESALGGASHMGRRDIAEYLISKGARPDIFTAAMLGHLDVVKTLLTLHPTLAEAKGPHGIPLIAHAKMGGKEAEAVFKYLETLKRP